MNIVMPLPIASAFPTNNVGTEAARRDNNVRELIPAASQGEKGAAEKGLAGEQERAYSNAYSNPTYDKPVSAQQDGLYNQNNAESADAKGSLSENAADQESSGKQDANEKQQEQAEQKQIDELKARDQEVRLHEQAHAAVGGQHAGSPTYEYEQGPDGKRYAVGGEVQIDVSEAGSPDETVRKMQQVQAAALAPAEPSAQDYKVAAEAAQKEQLARSEAAKEKVDSLDPESAKDESEQDDKVQNGLADIDREPSKISEKSILAKQTIDGFYASVAMPSTESNIAFTA